LQSSLGYEDSPEMEELGEGKIKKQNLTEKKMNQKPSVQGRDGTLETDQAGKVFPGEVQVEVSLKSHGIAGEDYGQKEEEGEVITRLTDLLHAREGEPAIC